MGRVNFYVPKEDEPIYEKAKEYAQVSISGVIVEQLKKYVFEKEKELSGMQEITLFEGNEDFALHESKLTGIKFIGKHLAGGTFDDYQDTERTTFNTYYTRKGKILVHGDFVIGSTRKQKYFIYDSMSEFISAGYPPEIVNSVLNNMPEMQFKILDI